MTVSDYFFLIAVTFAAAAAAAAAGVRLLSAAGKVWAVCPPMVHHNFEWRAPRGAS